MVVRIFQKDKKIINVYNLLRLIINKLILKIKTQFSLRNSFSKKLFQFRKNSNLYSNMIIYNLRMA